jgi:hypothetical protein
MGGDGAGRGWTGRDLGLQETRLGAHMMCMLAMAK